MNVEIRVATALDVPIILGFIRALAKYEKLEHEVVATEQRLRETLFGARPSAEVLLAFTGDRPVGFCLFFPTYSTFLAQPGLYIEDLFVAPEIRGHGIGLALFKAVAKLALDRGYGRMEWSVLDWNEPALRFYRRLGAKPMAEWTVQRLTAPQLRELLD